MRIINKALLRHIKHEGSNYVEYDNDVLTNSLLPDYTTPLSLWSYEELKTRYEELIHINWKVYEMYPEYYEHQYYGADGERWDILDEMENIAQMYGIDIYGE